MPQKKRRKKNNIENFAQTILNILRKDHSQAYNYKQIASKLGVDDPSSRNQIVKNLKELLAKGSIQEIERGKYILTPSQNYYTGRVDIAGRGQGYIIVDGLDDDIYISNKNLNKALNGDIVEVYVFKRKKVAKPKGKSPKFLRENAPSLWELLRFRKTLHLLRLRIIKCIPIFLCLKTKLTMLKMVKKY